MLLMQYSKDNWRPIAGIDNKDSNGIVEAFETLFSEKENDNNVQLFPSGWVAELMLLDNIIM